MRARQLLLSVTTALILITLPFVPLGAQPKEEAPRVLRKLFTESQTPSPQSDIYNII